MPVSKHETPTLNRTNDWITPKYIINALGTFVLDPCACDQQPWPTAARMLTRASNGLRQPWGGRVWLNPPYGKQLHRWMLRMAEHNDGIALIFARTETKAFTQAVWGKAAGLLFLEGRIHFHYPDGQKAAGNAGAPSVLVAYGKENAKILRKCELKGAYVEQKPRG
jgi:hypothetical protein